MMSVIRRGYGERMTADIFMALSEGGWIFRIDGGESGVYTLFLLWSSIFSVIPFNWPMPL